MADNGGVIEGGVAGGSALQQAAQRRATADRLIAEANWLEGLATDERSMAGKLTYLPPAYAILHDLRLPGSKGNIDHLVVGPGGAFAVVARRCSEAVTFHDDQVWVGGQSLRDVLEVARVESQLLTQSLGTTVVPVLALLGVMLPVSATNAVGGVLVCAAENIVRVVTRASHTLMPPHKVSEAVERALPLLHNPGSIVRTESALGVKADPVGDTSVKPFVPAVALPSQASVQRRLALQHAASRNGATGENPALPAAKPTTERASRPSGGPAVAVDASPSKERSGHRRSLVFIAVVLLGLSLIAVALGTIVRLLSDDGDEPAASETSAPAATALPVATTAAGLDGPLAASLVAPTVAFTPSCPAPGAGWQLVPVWPGDVPGLVRYDVELLNLAGGWSPLKALEQPVQPWVDLVSQPPNVTYTLRFTAVMEDGSRSLNAPTAIITPATAC